MSASRLGRLYVHLTVLWLSLILLWLMSPPVWMTLSAAFLLTFVTGLVVGAHRVGVQVLDAWREVLGKLSTEDLRDALADMDSMPDMRRSVRAELRRRGETR